MVQNVDLVPTSRFGEVCCKHVITPRESMSRVCLALCQSMTLSQTNKVPILCYFRVVTVMFFFQLTIWYVRCASMIPLCFFFKCWTWCLSVLLNESNLFWNDKDFSFFTVTLSFFLCDTLPDANCLLDAACVLKRFHTKVSVLSVMPFSCPLQIKKITKKTKLYLWMNQTLTLK